MSAPRRQRGVALLLVLWACTLLAVVLGSYAVLARTQALQVRYQFAQTQAHYAAEAGLMRAIQALQDGNPQRRWAADGRDYPFAFAGARVDVRIVDEGGKVDLNAASPEVLTGLFRAAGMDLPAAQALTANVVAWRGFLGSTSQAQHDRAAYVAAGRSYGPRHGPFATLEEFQQVLGVTPALYAKLAPALTIWSGRAVPDPNAAPPLALAAIPGLNPAQLAAVLASRKKNARTGGTLIAGGITHSIHARAELPDGARATVVATIRLRPGATGAQPYTVLRWQEGDRE